MRTVRAMSEGAGRAGREGQDRSAARTSDRTDVTGGHPAVGKSTLIARSGRRPQIDCLRRGGQAQGPSRQRTPPRRT